METTGMDKLKMQVHFNATRKECFHHITDTGEELNNILANDNPNWTHEKHQCYNTQAVRIQRAWRNYKDRVSLDNSKSDCIDTSGRKELIFQSTTPCEEVELSESESANHAMSVSSPDDEFSRNGLVTDASHSLVRGGTLDNTSDDVEDDEGGNDDSISSCSSSETLGIKLKDSAPLCIYEENDNLMIYSNDVKRESNEQLVKQARKQSYLTLAQEFATFKKSHPEALPFNMHKQLLAMFSRDTIKMGESCSESTRATDVPDQMALLSEKEKDENEKNILLSKDTFDFSGNDDDNVGCNSPTTSSVPKSKFPSTSPLVSTSLVEESDDKRNTTAVEKSSFAEPTSQRLTVQPVTELSMASKEPHRHHTSSNKNRGSVAGSRSSRGITRSVQSSTHVTSGKRQGQHGKRESMGHHRPSRPGLKLSSPELLGGFDVYNIETAMPTIDWAAMEEHLAKAAKEEEFLRRQRRNDREEIRRRLAMGSDTDEYYGGERITRKPSLQTRLQSGMNLQICFMNETANDPDNSNGDHDPEDSCKVGRVSLEQDTTSSNNAKNSELLTNIPTNLSTVLSSMKQCGVGDEKMDFVTRQAKLQAEARMALAQAKEMAHMQMEVEKQRKKKSPIAEMVGIAFPTNRRRTSRQLLNDMNVAQLQVIVNDLHTQIETLNEELVRLLLERDDLHMEQDSMLVDIEDLTRYLGAKDQAVKEKETKPSSLQKQMKSSPMLKLKLKK